MPLTFWFFFSLVDCDAKDGRQNSKLHPVMTRLLQQVITAAGRSLLSVVFRCWIGVKVGLIHGGVPLTMGVKKDLL